jgi:hypothetical protein
MRLDELGQAFIFRLFNMRLQYKDAHNYRRIVRLV